MAPWDSDLEADPDPPDWTRNLDSDVVDKMTPKEKQRQEVVNGIYSPHSASLPPTRSIVCYFRFVRQQRQLASLFRLRMFEWSQKRK